MGFIAWVIVFIIEINGRRFHVRNWIWYRYYLIPSITLIFHPAVIVAECWHWKIGVWRWWRCLLINTITICRICHPKWQAVEIFFLLKCRRLIHMIWFYIYYYELCNKFRVRYWIFLHQLFIYLAGELNFLSVSM